MKEQDAVVIAGIILAGGESSRMGVPKHTLEIGGRTLLDKQLGLLESVGLSPIFVSVARHAQVDYPVHLLLEDKYPSIGPLGGIATALELESMADVTHLCVIAIDLPGIDTALLAHLISHCTPTSGVIPAHSADSGVEPLCAIYPISSKEVALAHIHSKAYAVKDFAERLINDGSAKRYIIPAGEARQFNNVNSPEDFKRHQP
ncbi:MAG: molybdenum cofactor guanylyltransferase [Chthoniobacterales bacterium]